eukprot:gb/GECG01003621.1/.p1 GENE.gb/GECG01003621.1/~~gb/GECG01003621.1/.p1  ORF type:complete len:103 (+),score=4.82 gb/GECG01003621.1/:1-309(+)
MVGAWCRDVMRRIEVPQLDVADNQLSPTPSDIQGESLLYIGPCSSTPVVAFRLILPIRYSCNEMDKDYVSDFQRQPPTLDMCYMLCTEWPLGSGRHTCKVFV